MRGDSRVILKAARVGALLFEPVRFCGPGSVYWCSMSKPALRWALWRRFGAKEPKAVANRVSRSCNEPARGVRRGAATGIAVPNEADIVL
jgi:hypothetical protein